MKFLKGQADINLDRLQNVISSDKKINPQTMKKVLKRELFSVLEAYSDIHEEDFLFDIKVDDYGDYILMMKAKAVRIKDIKVLN